MSGELIFALAAGAATQAPEGTAQTPEGLASQRPASAGQAADSLEQLAERVERAHRTAAAKKVDSFRADLRIQELARDAETVFLMPALSWVYLSSSIVKDVAAHGGEVEGLVPPAVKEALTNKYDRAN